MRSFSNVLLRPFLHSCLSFCLCIFRSSSGSWLWSALASKIIKSWRSVLHLAPQLLLTHLQRCDVLFSLSILNSYPSIKRPGFPLFVVIFSMSVKLSCSNCESVLNTFLTFDICHMMSASKYFYVRSIHHSSGIQPVIFYNLCCRAFDTLLLIMSFKGCRAVNTSKSRAFDMSRLLCATLLI